MTSIYEWAARWGIPHQAIHELQLAGIPVAESADDGERESEISNQVRIEASRAGVALFRNNSGVGINPEGRTVRFGLGNDSKRINTVRKSSDLIGIDCAGRFIALEIKTKNWKYCGTAPQIAQKNFIDLVNRMNGRASFIRSVDEFRSFLRRG